MEYYCAMVKSGREEAFKKKFEEAAKKSQFGPEPFEDARVIFFKKRMKNSKGEKYQESLFKGYVFFSASKMSPALASAAKKCPSFYHFLNSDQDIRRLEGRDFEIVSNLLKFGETQGISKATFGKDQRISIISGPLLGFEGKIVKVNKKRGRATVKIDLCDNEMRFDLAFDEIKATF